jgi:protoheme IX farnesyltransferase
MPSRALPRFQLPAQSRVTTRIPDFIALMKPRVMLLAVFTALVGLMIAPGDLNEFLGSIAILTIAAGAGAAGVLNMWYDADIDAVMGRTAMRPIPRGTVSQAEALVFGLVLAGSAVAVLALAVNAKAAALLAFTIFFYVVVYTAWLKRHSPQNIVIGGAAGALPPVIGWVAATGDIGLEPIILFLVIFLWTPPHFWALSLYRVEDYARARIPMLPVVSGKPETRRQIVIYTVLVVASGFAPVILGFAGLLYLAVNAGIGLWFLVQSLRVAAERDTQRESQARKLFGVSIFYLFALFAALLV